MSDEELLTKTKQITVILTGLVSAAMSTAAALVYASPAFLSMAISILALLGLLVLAVVTL